MTNQLAMVKKDTVDVVAAKVKEFQESGELHFPAFYSPENSMKSAWLILQNTQDRNKRPALEVCTKDSIANALLDMVVQGLNPAKKQGYFIVYGNQLTFQRSYFGTMAVTKRVAKAKSIDAAVIYEGDSVDYEIINGRIANLKHKQQFGNIDKEKIIGAYATIVLPEDEVYIELMTIAEIRQAWSKAQFWSKGQDKEKEGTTHDEFKQEMAKKTVINRACKKFLNSSDDESIMMKHINKEDEEIEAQQEIDENANGEVLDMDYDKVTEEPKQIEETQEEPNEKQPEEPQEEVKEEKQSALEMEFVEEEPKKGGAPF
ncbi:recombinase RecT [Priestia megaterium]|uniref:recombinase RecT n=1 Tax=Priestia megaterium TaxID=1404 RepID=UPI000BF35D1B|nr:recombinase RecT [Priestia megaterium]PFI93379.1 recombinase [Priestia megaterium]PGR11804.1 recombinase [Priestia megaterium]